MHANYDDILNLIDKKPTWFDENAVPRFCDFSTDNLAYIYAKEAVLALIQCQMCQAKFKVAFSDLNLRDCLWKNKRRVRNICDLILDGTIHYGDPPNTGCCGVGATMNSKLVRIIEYWFMPAIHGHGIENGLVKDRNALVMQRDAKFEIDIIR